MYKHRGEHKQNLPLDLDEEFRVINEKKLRSIQDGYVTVNGDLILTTSSCFKKFDNIRHSFN